MSGCGCGCNGVCVWGGVGAGAGEPHRIQHALVQVGVAVMG